MDFLRTILGLSLCAHLSAGFCEPTAPPNTGIVFVHGTNDHRVDADGGYWKKDFIKNIARGLADPNNYLIVKCDFSQYMWDEEAAGCVARQTLEYIENNQVDSIIMYTHSDGANVLRFILSNPTYDERFYKIVPHIKRIIAIAPSSGGTALADQAISGSVFSESLSWLLGYRTDSVKQQREGDMAIYNDTILAGTAGRVSLIRPFLNIVGTDVVASPFTSSSYCNGYLLNAALKVTKLYLDSCADGFLSCRSQTAAGTTWFYDKEKTLHQNTLSHNQSRHTCSGLGQILVDDLISEGA